MSLAIALCGLVSALCGGAMVALATARTTDPRLVEMDHRARRFGLRLIAAGVALAAAALALTMWEAGR